MVNQKYSFRHGSYLCYFVLILLMYGFLSGCVPAAGTGGVQKTTRNNHYNPAMPLLSLFLHADKKIGSPLAISFKSIELFDGQQWHSAIELPFVYDSVLSKNEQVLVNQITLQPGSYSKIRIFINDVGIVDADNGNVQPLTLQTHMVTIDLVTPVILERFDRQCLFIVWDKQNSFDRNTMSFSPVFRGYLQEDNLTSELAYVSCPEFDLVYIIRTDTNRIQGSWSVPGKPTYLQAFKHYDEIYILAEKEHVVKVYELSSGRLKDKITIPLIVKPGCMVINAAKTSAYIVDQATDFLYRIDLASGSYVNRVQVGQKPGNIVYLEDQQRLAVASDLTQKVYFLDPNSLEIHHSISTGNGPAGMHNYNGDLYIAESKANSIMAYNFTTGTITRKNVGFNPSRLIESDDHIFVANTRSGTLSVLLSNQLSLLAEIRTGGKPSEMALSSNRRWLYGLDLSKGEVNIVDLTSQRLQHKIELGTMPFDIEIIN